MKTINRICTGLLVLGLLCLSGIAAAQDEIVLTDDIAAYNGPIGADSPLYGLKLALEDMDESFTANETERMDRQIEHARLRLSEVRRSLELNQSESAQQALDNYWMKMNLTNATISRWGSNSTGLLHAQEQIVKHQFVLENLLENHPNNTGLQRAYNNSIRLEEKFGEKTMVRFNRTTDKNNQTIMKAIRLEEKEYDRIGWPGINATADQTSAQQTEKEKNQNKKPAVTMVQQQGSPTQQPVTTTPVQQTEQEKNKNKNQGSDTPVPVTTQQQEQGQQQGGSNAAKGNSRGK
ncbi:MAG: DUF5667 domain-containing protein [Methanoregula sp.]|jgi:hypothetical protein